MATETLVSKASPAIKQIIDATFKDNWQGEPSWRGKVIVREEPLLEFHATNPRPGWYVNLTTLSTKPVFAKRMERFGPWIAPGPGPGEVLVVRGGAGLIIIVPEGMVDASAVGVATDALLAGDKKGAAATAKLCGEAGGLCMALAEAHAKALTQGESGKGRKTKKSAAQLDREIAVALARR